MSINHLAGKVFSSRNKWAFGAFVLLLMAMKIATIYANRSYQATEEAEAKRERDRISKISRAAPYIAQKISLSSSITQLESRVGPLRMPRQEELDKDGIPGDKYLVYDDYKEDISVLLTFDQDILIASKIININPSLVSRPTWNLSLVLMTLWYIVLIGMLLAWLGSLLYAWSTTSNRSALVILASTIAWTIGLWDYPMEINLKIFLDSRFWILMAMIASTVFMFSWSPRSKTWEPLCPTCGYNLRGNISGICPECGVKIPRSLIG